MENVIRPYPDVARASRCQRVVNISVFVIINIILITVTSSVLMPRISHHYTSLTWNWSADAHSGHIAKLETGNRY